MVFVEVPLTLNVRNTLSSFTGFVDDGTPAVRLHGGEESAAYRIGDFAVRLGADWRTDAEIEWCNSVAALAARSVPQVVAPLHTSNGSTVLRVDERAVTVWPFVDGRWPDDSNPAHFVEAANLLASVHASVRDATVGERPPRTSALPYIAELDDRELDAWLDEFDATHAHHPLHGDFYPGNMLARDQKIVALVDWDEALIGPAQREAAWAAWEWGRGLESERLEGCFAFIDNYVAAGGSAEDLDEIALRQLVRQRIRWEIETRIAAGARGVVFDEVDLRYRRKLFSAFHGLRPTADA